ncbi:hypothetical protein GF322_01965, partial [Candidatus Dependentiae bacterium]|nr:hypothetical protein [Candidatus Dependentiae bacterium]
SSVATANFQIVKGILKNALIAEKFVDGLKVYTQLAKKFGPKISQKAIKILKANPSLVEQEKDLASAANKVAEDIQKAKNSRRAAFRQAKRDANIPVSQQPEKVKIEDMSLSESRGGKKIKDKYGNIIKTKEYYYKNKNDDKIIIQDHGAGHKLGNQGPHFNVRPINNRRTGDVDGTKKHYPFDK